MDRASELRALMKAKATGGLTGKDKAKYLKSLREEKKEKTVETKPITALKTSANDAVNPITDSTMRPANMKQVRVVSIPSLYAPSRIEQTNTTVTSSSVSYKTTDALAPLGGLVSYDEDDDDEDQNGKNVSTANSSSSSAGPPAGFFDEPEESVSTSLNQKPQSQYTSSYDFDHAPELNILQPNPSRVNAAEEYTEHLLAEAGANSVIPRGFFDDPLADLKARGVDIKKIEKKQEKRGEEELRSFLGALEEIQDGDTGLEKEEDEEEKERLVEEEMMQLNYERKVAVLLHQSDRVLALKMKRAQKAILEEEEEEEGGGEDEEGGTRKRVTIASSTEESRQITTAEMQMMMDAATEEGEAIFSSMLGASVGTPSFSSRGGEEDKGDLTLGNRTKIPASDVKHDVAQFLKKKKADSKKQHRDALLSDYNPLDFMDWTARSL